MHNKPECLFKFTTTLKEDVPTSESTSGEGMLAAATAAGAPLLHVRMAAHASSMKPAAG